MRRAVAVAALLAVALQGCGVPDESRPRPIEPSLVIGSPPPRASGNSAGAVIERLYLVRDEQLVPVERRVSSTDVATLLADLIVGPTDAERDEGLSSALTGTDLIAGVQLVDGTAEVSFRRQAGGRTDDILAIGQIVCTLDAHADVDTVQFLVDGQVLKVPRADGVLTQVPLTVTDYGPLITER